MKKLFTTLLVLGATSVFAETQVVCAYAGKEFPAQAIKEAQKDLNYKLKFKVKSLESVSEPSLSTTYGKSIYGEDGIANANICVTVTAKSFDDEI